MPERPSFVRESSSQKAQQIYLDLNFSSEKRDANFEVILQGKQQNKLIASPRQKTKIFK